MRPSDAQDEQDETAAVERFTMHWAVFLPSVAIAVLYTIVWFWFSEISGPAGGMSRAALLVLAVGVPMLVVHAALRYINGSLEVGADQLVARPGRAVRHEVRIAYDGITGLKLKRGLIGRVLDVGTLIITDANGQSTIMPDLAQPERALEATRARAGMPDADGRAGHRIS